MFKTMCVGYTFSYKAKETMQRQCSWHSFSKTYPLLDFGRSPCLMHILDLHEFLINPTSNCLPSSGILHGCYYNVPVLLTNFKGALKHGKCSFRCL